jgi:S-adenosylmethionine/arginine decarboxylase-like enzyme
MKDLAPGIYRQRAVIEGISPEIITSERIKRYLRQLSDVLEMVTLLEPITHRSDRFGEAGWIHWETSGAHFYAWEHPINFFSVDIYTCKAFDVQDAVTYTNDFFNCIEIEYKEF